jgi:hypothetical protein
VAKFRLAGADGCQRLRASAVARIDTALAITMSLTRDDLKNGRFRRLWTECATGPRPLSDEELDASVACVLAGAREGEDVWVFGYGSLMWNPLFHYAEPAWCSDSTSGALARASSTGSPRPTPRTS